MNLFAKPPHNRTRTSRDAAETTKRSGKFEQRRKASLWLIVQAGGNGLTAYEVMDKFNAGSASPITMNQLTGPLKRLADERLIVSINDRRPTGRGGTSQVYVATTAGREASKK